MSYQDEISILKLVRDTCYQPIEVKKAMTVAIQSMEKLQEYEKLGTLEEVREAVEKQIPKKPKTKILCRDIKWWCPNCGENHVLMYAKKGFKYCHNCGQKLDWSEEDE